jgi:hypothetical protein
VTDAEGEKLEADARYFYDVDDQAFRKSENGNVTAEHIKLLRVMTHNNFKVVRKVTGIGELLPECLRLAQVITKL